MVGMFCCCCIAGLWGNWGRCVWAAGMAQEQHTEAGGAALENANAPRRATAIILEHIGTSIWLLQEFTEDTGE